MRKMLKCCTQINSVGENADKNEAGMGTRGNVEWGLIFSVSQRHACNAGLLFGLFKGKKIGQIFLFEIDCQK